MLLLITNHIAHFKDLKNHYFKFSKNCMEMGRHTTHNITMDIGTTRLNWPWGQFTENLVFTFSKSCPGKSKSFGALFVPQQF